MRCFARIKVITRKDRIRNTVVVEELNMVPIEEAREEIQLSLLRRVHRMNEERLAREIFEVKVLGKNKVGRPQRRWVEQV